MAGISTIDQRSSMETLYEQAIHTHVRLLASADPDVKALAVPFEAWEEAWWAAYKKERGLLKAVMATIAMIERIDNQLDTLSDGVAVLARLEDKANKINALMTMLYGTLTPSAFKRPLMGQQFEAMKGWPPTLKGANNDGLKAHSAQLETLLQEGTTALEAASDAERQSQEFRLTGDRRVLTDNLNALRKSTHGKLGEIAHQKSYGNGFAESFFRRESGSRDLSLDEVERLEAKRGSMIAAIEADEKARAEAEKKAKAAALAEAEKAAAEAAAHVAALKAEMGE